MNGDVSVVSLVGYANEEEGEGDILFRGEEEGVRGRGCWTERDGLDSLGQEMLETLIR